MVSVCWLAGSDIEGLQLQHREPPSVVCTALLCDGRGRDQHDVNNQVTPTLHPHSQEVLPRHRDDEV